MGISTHAICLQCWGKHYPKRGKPVGMAVERASTCCFCGKPTRDGIFVREDMSRTPFCPKVKKQTGGKGEAV